jgi:hypothetical protein
MEYVHGESLGDRIEREGKLPPDQAVRIVAQVAQGLHQAHQQGIVHRDVKPDNILIAADGQAKLTDLGLVKEMDGNLNLTHTGRGLGTPHFMAPEQFRDAKSVDARSDIYSLGATLYVAVTGKLPFDSPNPIDTFMRKVNNQYVPPRQLAPDLPPHVERAIRRAMHADPAQRPATCPDFVRDLTPEEASAEAPTVPDVAPAAFNLFGAERRAVVRYPSRQGGNCHAIGGDSEVRWSAKIQDISEGGVALLLRRRFEPGTVLTVDLRGSGEPLARRLLVRVVRVQLHSHRRWLMGCAFARRLSSDEVQSLR